MIFYKEKLFRFIAIVRLFIKKKKKKRANESIRIRRTKQAFRSDILIKGSNAFNELPTSLLALFIQYSIKFRSIELTPSFRPTPPRSLLPRRHRSSFPVETWNDMAEDKMETCPPPSSLSQSSFSQTAFVHIHAISRAKAKDEGKGMRRIGNF